MKEALFYEATENKGVICGLCPHNCKISKDKSGLCGVRKNIDGKLYSLVYGKPCSIAIDPIEKKPLYHFNPGEKILSFGTFGCNLACKQCQNFEISKEFDVNEIDNLATVSPEDMIKICLREGLHMIAFTYNEPTIYYEYMLDIAKEAHKHKIQTVMVSNGFINEEPLKKLLPYIDAANIDLKSFDNTFYNKVCNGALNPVLNSLKLIKKKCHLEITTLLIPSLNDSLEMISEMSKWIKDNLSADTPLHISRFFPMYKLKHLPPTDIKFLLDAKKAADKYLQYVHVGNV
jgi:pyruvate formate lyase activating enzyme